MVEVYFSIVIVSVSLFSLCFCFTVVMERSKDRTQAAESVKWRPQQAYGSNQVLFAQPQTIFSTPKILTRMRRYNKRTARAARNTRYQGTHAIVFRKEHTLSLQ